MMAIFSGNDLIGERYKKMSVFRAEKIDLEKNKETDILN